MLVVVVLDCLFGWLGLFIVIFYWDGGGGGGGDVKQYLAACGQDIQPIDHPISPDGFVVKAFVSSAGGVG